MIRKHKIRIKIIVSAYKIKKHLKNKDIDTMKGKISKTTYQTNPNKNKAGISYSSR
jgi:hypothetical protein